MKILQINSVVNTGSTGRIAENIGLSVMEQSWESFIAFGRGQPESKSSLINVGSKCDFYVHVLRTRLFDQHGLGSINASKDLVVKIKEVKPDIIHLHNIHGYYLNIEVLFTYLEKINIPVVWTLHDCWSFTGHCAHYTFVKCEKWKESCFNCPQKNEYPKSWFVDNSRGNYQLKKNLFCSLKNMIIVPVSKWLSSEVKQSFLGKYPTRVIYNGIDLATFRRKTQTYLKTTKFILLSLATTWSKRKGLDDFIKLSSLLNQDELIVLVGLTKSQIQNLPKNIIGIERTESQEELTQLYSQAGIVLSLSVEETFGLTIAEGFACGTPAIVYNSTATPELITPETGEVVEPHNIRGLREAIDRIRNSNINYTKTCRERAERLYNKDDRYNDYIELYKEILNKR